VADPAAFLDLLARAELRSAAGDWAEAAGLWDRVTAAFRDLDRAQADDCWQAWCDDERLRDLLGVVEVEGLSRDEGWRTDLRLLARELKRRTALRGPAAAPAPPRAALLVRVPGRRRPGLLPVQRGYRPSGRAVRRLLRPAVRVHRRPPAGSAADVIMVAMVPITRLFADDDGHARFEDIEIPLVPGDPPPDAMSVSQPWQAAAVLFGHGPAGGSQPEHRRQLVIGISGRVEVTATGETRTFGPGDILLVEDTDGFGHSSRTSEGFVAAFVVLEP